MEMPPVRMPKVKMPKGWTDWKAEQERKRARREMRRRIRARYKKALWSTEEGRLSRLLTGLVTAAAGLPAIMIGAGMWRMESTWLDAPLSVVLCAGLMFVGGGLSVALSAVTPELESDGALPPYAPRGVRALQFFLSASAAAGFAGVATWAVLTHKAHDLAMVLGAAFAFGDVDMLELRLQLWLMFLAGLLWIFALIGVTRGLLRLR